MNEHLPPELELQIKVSKILSYGFVFSLTGLAGVGSLIALILGLRALIMIRRSRGRIVGLWLAWWCIIVGAAGAIITPLLLIAELRKHWKW